MCTNPITQAPMVQNADGSRKHPDLPRFDKTDSKQWQAWLDEQGMEAMRTWLEDEQPAASLVGKFHTGLRAEAMAAWQPRKPNGDDSWMLLCVTVAEYGPCAYFIRPRGARPAVRTTEASLAVQPNTGGGGPAASPAGHAAGAAP